MINVEQLRTGCKSSWLFSMQLYCGCLCGLRRQEDEHLAPWARQDFVRSMEQWRCFEYEFSNFVCTVRLCALNTKIHLCRYADCYSRLECLPPNLFVMYNTEENVSNTSNYFHIELYSGVLHTRRTSSSDGNSTVLHPYSVVMSQITTLLAIIVTTYQPHEIYILHKINNLVVLQ